MQNQELPENTEEVEAESVGPPPLPGDERDAADGDAEFVPRGAMVFGLILILGYIIYYFLIWHEVVILRGGA